MGLPALSEAQVDDLVTEFEETGYVVFPLLTEPEVRTYISIADCPYCDELHPQYRCHCSSTTSHLPPPTSHRLNTALATQIESLRGAFEVDRRSFPELWTLRGSDARGGPTGESGRWQSSEVMRTSPGAFGPVVCHPRVLQLSAALIGDAARMRNCQAMWREPVPEAPPPNVPQEYAEAGIHWQLWHREAGGTTSPDHPRVIPSLQMIVYLDDCDAGSHCFSVVKECGASAQACPATGQR